MTRGMRTYLGIVLALLLAVTGQSMAVARGMPGAEGSIVLCTGTGPVMVTVDDNGQPVGPPHICPDFAAMLFAVHAEPPLAVSAPVVRGMALRPADTSVTTARRGQRATARGPPAAA